MGQDPVSIPYYVDISPCRTCTLYITSQPSDLVIDRTAESGNINQYPISPTYHNLFASNKLSYCPVLDYLLKDTIGNALNNPKITLVNPGNPPTARIDVRNDIGFTQNLRIQGYTMNKNTYLNLKIRVCGEETIALTSSSTVSFLLGIARGIPALLPDADRYFSLDHETMMAYFSVSPANDPCILNFFERVFTPEQLGVKPSLNNEVFLTGSFGNSDFLRFDKTVATNVQTVKLRAQTRGLVDVHKVFEYVVCPATGGNTIVKPITHWE